MQVQQAPQMQTAPDIVDAGRVLATLDDWRAVLFMAGFIIIFLLLFTIWRELAMQAERRLMSEERKEMKALAASFAASASEVAKPLHDLSAKITVLALLAGRTESTNQEKLNG